MKYIGGYSILDLTDANVSAQANACYNQDKPVLVYGANGERYFADTITKSGTNIIVTKGGKTITIASDNTITNVGDIQNHLYQYLISSLVESYNFNCTILSKDNVNITTYNELLSFLGTDMHIANGIGDEGNGAIIVSIKVVNNIIKGYGYELDEGSFSMGQSSFDILNENNDFDLITITKTQLF